MKDWRREQLYVKGQSVPRRALITTCVTSEWLGEGGREGYCLGGFHM